MKSLPPLTASRRHLACAAALACFLTFGAALKSTASTVTLDFDSVSPTATGVDPTAYLASFGVTLSGVGPSNPMIYSDLAFYGSGVVDASSGHNFLLQQSAVNGGTFRLNFGTALTDLQFTRIANVANNLVGTWTATVYAGASVVGSVSEPFGLGPFSPATYSFSAPGITSLVISGNGYGSAGISSLMLDDLKLTTAGVPDSGSTLALLGASLVIVALRRRSSR